MRRFSLICVLCFAVCVVSIAKQKMEWVDLGLPSGTLWATCNVGAESPTDMGDKFMWGEVNPYVKGKVHEYEHYGKGFNKKYNPTIHYDVSQSFTINRDTSFTARAYDHPEYWDYKLILDPEDDAATVNCGKEWTMPTAFQLQELRFCKYLKREIVENYNGSGISGVIITSIKNGNSIFLPEDTALFSSGKKTKYWAKTLNITYYSGGDYADVITIRGNWSSAETKKYVSDFRRHYNYIRPVRIKK